MDIKYNYDKYSKKLKDFWSKFKGKPLIFSVIFLSISFFTFVIVWNLLASLIGVKIIEKIDDMRERGVNISVYDHAMSGFPNNFILTFDNPLYKNSDKTFGWTTEQLIVTPLSLSERAVRIDFITDHHFSLRKYGEEKPRRIAVRAENLRLATKFKDVIPNPLNLSADSVITQIFTKDFTFRMGRLVMTAYNDEVVIKNRLENMITLEMNVINIGLTSFWKGILEDNFDQFTALLHIRNPGKIKDFPRFSFYALRGFDQPEIIIERAKLFHRLSDFTLSGLLRVDEDLTLNGEVLLSMSNYQKALAFLEKKGVITPSFAQYMRGIFSFMTLQDDAKKLGKSVDIKLIIKKNKIYRNNILLWEIPSIL